MNGFYVRVAAQCDRAARKLQGVADCIRAEGLDAQPKVLRDVAAAVSRLAFDATKQNVDYNRVGAVTYDSFRAIQQVAYELHALASGPRAAIFLKNALDLESVARIMSALHADTLKETQPIDPPKR